MKRYTVVCHPSVEDQLAQLLLDHWGQPLAAQIVSAADRIDTELGNRPWESTDPSADKLRSIVVVPLSVEVEIHEDDRRVVVLGYQLIDIQ